MHPRARIPPIGVLLSYDPLPYLPVSPDVCPAMDPILVMRGAWHPQEDALLRSAVNRFGAGQWDFIAAVIPGRSALQCRERWNFRIGPGLNKMPFEQWEDALIIRERERYGNHWTLISSHLPGRTSCAVKNRWYSVLRKHYRSGTPERQAAEIPMTVADLLSHPVCPRAEVST
jgi:hypothetical protein